VLRFSLMAWVKSSAPWQAGPGRCRQGPGRTRRRRDSGPADGLGEVVGGLGGLAQVAVSNAPIVPGVRILQIQGDGLGEVGDRLLVLAQLAVSKARLYQALTNFRSRATAWVKSATACSYWPRWLL